MGRVSEFRTEVGVSGESQVSVKKSTSRALSKIKSCRTDGLSRSEVTADAERMFSEATERVIGLEGPGFSSTLPLRKSKKKIKSEDRRRKNKALLRK